ncbi:MAG: hypothetical protein A3J84_00465 [Ignavibacteria bacterium RIFOXYA2_FULL_37_17]|nr:MAG: hypothetical protein A3J84_00465 [Ignavibacteria bacterium RIFOXYA2_FULL_37_17]
MQTAATPSSPCNNECIMNPVTHFCQGCFRTIEEIIRWSFISPDEKNEILQKVEIRKISLKKESKE